MLERIHLAVVQEVEKQGSLTAAAEVLCVTQSALSHSMKKLEQQLGTDLWLGEGRTLRLTLAGQNLPAEAGRERREQAQTQHGQGGQQAGGGGRQAGGTDDLGQHHREAGEHRSQVEGDQHHAGTQQDAAAAARRRGGRRRGLAVDLGVDQQLAGIGIGGRVAAGGRG
ncbi:MAG: helix-turn-helix domain-containing protein, partial [Brevundimonas aurantiaca]|uniref:helix-turn-helix domain-containing protein n=1 Tax=Brevundimonas aurantiaca TaxID=74316 RepID=UPI0040335055